MWAMVILEIIKNNKLRDRDFMTVAVNLLPVVDTR